MHDQQERTCFSEAMLQCRQDDALQAFLACKVLLRRKALAARNLGSIVEACDSAAPVIVGYLQVMANAGALVLPCTNF